MPDRLVPYLWEQLPRLSATQARTATLVARWIAALDAGLVVETLRALLGCSVQFQGITFNTRRPNPHAPTLTIEGDAHVAVELSGTLAAWIVDRALGGDATLRRLEAGPAMRNEAARGVLAYVAARTLQALPGHHAVADVLADNTPLLGAHDTAAISCVSVRILWDGIDHPVHVWMLRPPSSLPARSIRRSPLRDVLLRQPVVLSARLASRPVIAATPRRTLLIDDVIVLTGSELVRHGDSYLGQVELQVLGTRAHVWLGHLNGDRIELQERLTMEHDGLTTGNLLSPSATPDALQHVADVPLELSVEIARFTLPLAEIASLTPGEVLLTGRPVGQHVTLRAGTAAIATAELVSVDGAIGVRILTLAGT